MKKIGRRRRYRYKKMFVRLGTLAVILFTVLIFACGAKERNCDHDWDSGIVTKEPTCSDTGVIEYTCEKCGKVEKRELDPNPDRHDWSKWKVTESPTYVSEGVRTRTCVDCGAQETSPAPRKDAADKWVSQDDKDYYIDSNGELATGWTQVKTGKKGIKKDTWCFFASDGALVDKDSAAVSEEFGTDTYILVEKDKQILLYVEGGELVQVADVLTGTKDTHETPSGTYSVGKKKEDITLYWDGNAWDVDYWIPFSGDLLGFHDADWRSEEEFGDTEQQQTDGSHGCVNMRDEDIEDLYERVEEGTMVIIR